MEYVKRVLRVALDTHDYLRLSEAVSDGDRGFLASVSDDTDDSVAADCIEQLCSMLERHYGVKPIVHLDEFDAPMQ